MHFLRILIEQILQEEMKDLDEDLESRQAFASDLAGSNLTPTDLDYDEPENLQQALKMGRPVKQLFAKHADHNWLKTLTTVHFVHSTRKLETLLTNISSRDELSCMAFLPGQLTGSHWGDYGLVIKGHITLLANDMDDIVSGRGYDIAKHNPERTKHSGANKGIHTLYPPESYTSRPIIVLDKEDWKPSILDKRHNNEALVDNWKPVALFVQDSTKKKIADAKALIDSLDLNIPIMTWAQAKKTF